MTEISLDIKDRKSLGDAIKGLRILNNVSIRGLASLCGLSKTTIVNIENGDYSPRMEIVTNILEKLNAKLVIKDDEKGC